MSFEYALSQTQNDSTYYYYQAIVNPKTVDHLPSGIRFYTNQRLRHKESADTLSLIKDLRMLAIGEFKIGNVYDSENYIVQALELINTNSAVDTLVNARLGLYNQLGRVYRTLIKPEEAINVFDKALEIAPSTKDSIIILNNKANIFKDLKEYENASEIYKLLIPKSINVNDSLQLALVLDNLGQIQSQLENDEAIMNLILALQIRKNKSYSTGMYSSYRNLSKHYFRIGNTAVAKSYTDSAYNIAAKINSSSYKLDALSLYVEQNGDSKILEFKKLNDSLETAKLLSENKNAFAKYNIDEERKKTEANRLLQVIEKGKRIKYQSLAAFILVLLIASYFIYRYRYKKAKIEEVYKTETRISKKIHDEVANDMYRLMTDLESNAGTKPSVLDNLEKIYLKTRDISRETNAIDVQTDFENNLNDMLLGYKSETVSVVTLNLKKINWNGISDLKKTAIYRVLQELMTNMRKHSKATSVAISFEKKGSKIEIKYSDNGSGCSLKKANGLQNTENRIRSLNGTINFDSSPGNGFKANILV